MSGKGILTYVGVAHPWMCDEMGHLNVRHYAAMFDDASFQLLGRIAGPDADKRRLGWADVRTEIDYRHETAAGALLSIHTRVETIGNSSVVYVHVMEGTVDGIVRAQARTTTVRFDLVARSKIALDDESRRRASGLSIGDGR